MGKVKKKRGPNEIRILARLVAGGPLYRIAKIVGPADGGFALYPSMHIDAPGCVMKNPVDYNQIGTIKIPYREVRRKFTARTPVKLSYHPSGFAQFSSAGGNILSGTTESGQIKGIGIYTSPLSQPIRSGPAAGILTWGIEDFNVEIDVESGVLIFDVPSTECHDAAPNEANAFAICIFTIPKDLLQYATKDGGRRIFSDVFTFNGLRRNFDLRVIELPCKKMFLGVWGYRTKAEFEAPSGWSLGGPGNSRWDLSGGYTINAIYPSPLNEEVLNEMQSLEFGFDNPIPLDSDTRIVKK
jgi:hypothetical protein